MNNIAEMDQTIIDIYDYIAKVADVNLDEKVEYCFSNNEADMEEIESQIIDLRQRALQFTTINIMEKYLTYDISTNYKKRKIILYMFYEIYNYTLNYTDEQLQIDQQIFTNLYNLKDNDLIIAKILNNNLLTPIINSYMFIIDNLYVNSIDEFENIDFTEAEELAEKSQKDFEENELYSQEQNTELLPNLCKYTLEDLNNIYLLANIDENTKLDMMYYDIFDTDENYIPSPTDISFDALFQNNSIFLEDFYLSSFIYFSCKANSLGLTQEEYDLYNKIIALFKSDEKLYIPDTYDGKIMLKAYLHMASNKQIINTNHKNTVNNCLKLVRKKINPISTYIYK